jgi:ferritin-like metal-binding protein YciE
MSKSGKDLLITWLKDAYAMERSLSKSLERQARHAEEADDPDPGMAARLRQHHQETERHADEVRMCLQQHGEDVSRLKSGVGIFGGIMQGLASGPARDTAIKDCLAGIAAEHFEIACYRSLIAAAEQLGDMETAGACRGILREEEEMARWLESQLPMVTQHELAGAA